MNIGVLMFFQISVLGPFGYIPRSGIAGLKGSSIFRTNGENGDRLIDGEQNDSWCRGRLGSRGIEQKGKRTHGHGQQYGNCWRERGITGLNGNGKNVQ